HHVGFHVIPALRRASSKAASRVGPAVGCAPALVPLHLCGPLPSLPSSLCPCVFTLPSKSVFVFPSTRTWTVMGELSAALAGAAASAPAMARTARPRNRVLIGLASPSARDSGCRPEAGLLAPGFAWPRLPGERSSPVAWCGWPSR